MASVVNFFDGGEVMCTTKYYLFVVNRTFWWETDRTPPKNGAKKFSCQKIFQKELVMTPPPTANCLPIPLLDQCLPLCLRYALFSLQPWHNHQHSLQWPIPIHTPPSRWMDSPTSPMNLAQNVASLIIRHHPGTSLSLQTMVAFALSNRPAMTLANSTVSAQNVSNGSLMESETFLHTPPNSARQPIKIQLHFNYPSTILSCPKRLSLTHW